MTTKSCGPMSRTSMKVTLTLKQWSFLEQLFKEKNIKNYTYDGWLLVTDEWYPIEFGLKKLGDNTYNEYLEHCR